ncbi:hypothetical protein LTS07_002981 [Exophiala sideris]|uniref:Uncharacterized protein n=1 Tax=Exophiala sideris TaxID=1016849 RepID=A0ABR0JLB6_9EURO|nr:hypothetical protein LTS07_002981 [Exophiala sideris]KAK5066467.1 hypothetical protein LTR69_002987 [Exophiala sideris]KAK5187144.1 hypothetical protein LTR44_001152 [Eurotiomycetes sp. CCFEE 6388]
MATGRKGSLSTPNALLPDPQIEASYRSWQSRRPQLFRQSSSLVNMAPNTKVQICVIADDQEHAVKLPNTVYDGTLQRSLISKAKAMATRGLVQVEPTTTLTDYNGNTYTTASTICLRWYYENGLQTFQETFYIVDKLPRADGNGEMDAILRAGVESDPAQGPAQAFPYFTAPRDPRRDEDQRKKEEKRLKQYQAEKEAQAARIREKLAKNLKAAGKG